MAHMLIRHQVEDFRQWMPVFEDHRPARQEAGLKDLHLWQNADNPGEVLILLEASDLAKARDFAGSADLKDKMQAAGVKGAPDIVFLAES